MICTMSDLYWFSSIQFYSTTKMNNFLDRFKIEAKGFVIVEQIELTPQLKRLRFMKDEQSIQLYIYIDGQLDEVILFVQEGPLKEQFINQMKPNEFSKRGFHHDIFIAATEPQEIIQTIEGYFQALENESPDFLHIYGQQMWHSDAFIVGNRAALERLYKGIGEALQHGEKREVFSPVDGEGYDLYISCVEDAFDFEQLDAPYHDPEIFEKRKPPLTAFKLYKVEE